MKVCMCISLLVLSFFTSFVTSKSQQLSIKAYLVYNGGKE